MGVVDDEFIGPKPRHHPWSWKWEFPEHGVTVAQSPRTFTHIRLMTGEDSLKHMPMLSAAQSSASLSRYHASHETLSGNPTSC